MRIKQFLSLMLVLVTTLATLHVTSCGTILYPERRGQQGGRLDVGVVLLDAIGLLFFLLPGVIAFAVDFTTGTIYLPGTQTSLNDPQLETMVAIQCDPHNMTPETIQQAIAQHTGQVVDLRDDRLLIQPLPSAQ